MRDMSPIQPSTQKDIKVEISRLRLVSVAIVLSFASQAQALDAPSALVPAGLAPGSTFYIMFATSTAIAGNQSVANYNAHTNTAAALSASTATIAGWRAWLAHDDGTVQTATLFAADNSRPIYNTRGLKIADNYADLTDNSLAAAIEFDESGVSRGGNFVYTGTSATGTAANPSDDTLGGADVATDGCLAGTANSVNTQLVFLLGVYSFSSSYTLPLA